MNIISDLNEPVLISRDAWKSIHKDFKKIINGQRFVMADRGNLGVQFWPVEFINEDESE